MCPARFASQETSETCLMSPLFYLCILRLKWVCFSMACETLYDLTSASLHKFFLTSYSLYLHGYHCSALEEQTSPNVFLIFTLSSLTHTSLCSALISISKIQLKQSWTRHNSHGSKSSRPSLVLNLIFSLIIFNGSLYPF